MTERRPFAHYTDQELRESIEVQRRLLRLAKLRGWRGEPAARKTLAELLAELGERDPELPF